MSSSEWLDVLWCEGVKYGASWSSIISLLSGCMRPMVMSGAGCPAPIHTMPMSATPGIVYTITATQQLLHTKEWLSNWNTARKQPPPPACEFYICMHCVEKVQPHHNHYLLKLRKHIPFMVVSDDVPATTIMLLIDYAFFIFIVSNSNKRNLVNCPSKLSNASLIFVPLNNTTNCEALHWSFCLAS